MLQWAGAHKQVHQLLVGFALETNNSLENGKGKLERKNLDFIVINQPETGKTGFGADTNKITLLDNHNKLTKFELKSKKQVANDIVEYYINYKK